MEVATNQFFWSHFQNHYLTSNFVSNLKYNATDSWATLFDPTFNINLQITDLPIGQLAEAQINSFDQYGRPNGGTLLIDADANGVGWFIDQTPWENGEFTQTLADTAFRATTGEAAGKYDLTTPGTQLTLNQPLTFKVDLTGIQAGTAATLYFDLLGFGARDGRTGNTNKKTNTNPTYKGRGYPAPTNDTIEKPRLP
ncbi:MAG: hypothetical protein HC785_19300 [Calothrix sp. CSU_2_0]|nr:hypothetical protein [Calothrix sp. CSU_2_0]